MPIKSAALFLTEDCNLRCRYCYVPKKPRRLAPKVGREAVDFMLAAPPSIKKVSICFFGGEPLLEFETLKALVDYGEQRSKEVDKPISFSMTTNGTLVSDEVFDFLVGHKIRVNLSCDGGQKTQNANRKMVNGNGSFDLVDRTLKRLVKHNAKQGIRMTFDPSSAGAIYENVQYLWSCGVTNLSVVPAVECNWTEPTLAEARAQYQRVAEEVVERMREGDHRRIGFMEKYVKRIATSKQRPKRQCGAGNAYVGISVDGDIYACHRFIAYGGFKFGNFDCVANRADRERFLTYDSNRFTGCDGCRARLTCGGGCSAINFACTGDIDAPAPNQCEFIRMQYDIGKWFHDTLKAEKSPLFDRIVRPQQKQERQRNSQRMAKDGAHKT